MALQNTSKKFGTLTKLLHWLIFALFVVQFYLVYRREYFPEKAPEKLQYILLHKSFGVALLVLAVLMLLWRFVGTRPLFPGNNPLEKSLAKLAHFLLYLSMLLMPLSGIAMSLYGGRAIKVFDWFTIPAFVDKNKALAGYFYNTHVYTSYFVIGLVSFHVIGALYHHFIKHDTVLKRMTFGKV